MPFTNAHHGGRREAADLASRIEAELRTRIEEAVDMACLEAMVKSYHARGLPAPAAESSRDREQFEAHVGEFLERLRGELVSALTVEERKRLGEVVTASVGADFGRAMTLQVVLARELPDYWQRFDAARLSYAAEPDPSGRQGRSLLGRLLRRH